MNPATTIDQVVAEETVFLEALHATLVPAARVAQAQAEACLEALHAEIAQAIAEVKRSGRS